MLKKLFSKRIGQAKELEAKQWLQAQNIKIIAENETCKGGEIDLIGEIQTPLPTLIFFEIKYRSSDQFGHPLETLSQAQINRIRRCAERYCQKHPGFNQHLIRFDVIAWQGEQEKEWLKNAF